MAQQKMTLEDLSNYDGRDGRKAYIAVSGKVYDVSESPRWQEGSHEGSHQAGADLTEELKAAPHVRSVIERFPVVADLVEATVETQTQKSGAGLWVAIVAIVVVVIAWFVLKS